LFFFFIFLALGRLAGGLDPINTPSTLERCNHQSGGLQELQMLDDRRPRYRQAARELTGRHRRPRKTLEDYYANRMAEQGKYAQDRPKRRTVCVRLGHDSSVRLN
jgi:hypothetical protein